MKVQHLIVATGFALLTNASATTWLGGEATTNGYGVHLGQSLLRVPLIGNIGLEGAAEKGWTDSNPNRFAAGLTLRDVNLPLTKVDAFATVGAEYKGGAHLYAEGGLRGPIFGPAGWRAFARANTANQIGAGVGLELRF